MDNYKDNCFEQSSCELPYLSEKVLLDSFPNYAYNQSAWSYSGKCNEEIKRRYRESQKGASNRDDSI